MSYDTFPPGPLRGRFTRLYSQRRANPHSPRRKTHPSHSEPMKSPRENANTDPDQNVNLTEDITELDRPATAPGRMLCDLIRNCQVISAELPPDDWDDGAAPPRIERKQSGTFSLSLSEPPTRRVVSAPAPSPSRSNPRTGKSTRPRYYSANNISEPSAYYAAAPTTPAHAPSETYSSSSEGLIPEPLRLRDQERYGCTQDGPYPSMASPRSSKAPSSSVHPALRDQGLSRSPFARLNISRTRLPMEREGSEDSLLPRGGTFTHTNGVHLPSPLRNVSLPGDDFEDVELMPLGLPRQAYELSGPSQAKQSWFRRWFCCGGSRK